MKPLTFAIHSLITVNLLIAPLVAEPVVRENGAVKRFNTNGPGKSQGRVSVGPVQVDVFDYGDRWNPYNCYTVDSLESFRAQNIPQNGVGSRADMKPLEATGFYRVEKVDGRWWFIDPKGNRAFLSGINGLGKQHARDGSQESVDQALALLRENGFNAFNASSQIHAGRLKDAQVNYPKLSYLMLLHRFLVDNHINDESMWTAPPLWDDEVLAYMDEVVKNECAPFKDDPFLVGYMTDNEIHWKPYALDVYYHYFENPEPYEIKGKNWERGEFTYTVNPGEMKSYKLVGNWVKQNGYTKGEDGFSWEARVHFQEFMAEQYSRITTEAILKADPNHLTLGPRHIRQDMSCPGIMKGMGKHLDVMAINYYGAWPFDPTVMGAVERWSGRPIMITEFSAQSWETIPRKGRDAWIVKSQEDRGIFYQNNLLAAYQSPSIIGTLWFAYYDFGQDANYGIINAEGEPYTECLKLMKQVNDQRYDLIDYLSKNPVDFDSVYDPIRNKTYIEDMFTADLFN